MRSLLRIPIVVLVALAVALGLGGAAQARSVDQGAERGADQVWGFVDTPAAASAGWQGPLTVAWRNASEETRTFEVHLDGSDLPEGTSYSQSWTITATPGECFRDELALPALDLPGTYTARLTLDGVDVVMPAEIVVRRALPEAGDDAGSDGVRVLDLRRAASGATFRVSHAARISSTVLDARGRTVRHRVLGLRAAGRVLRAAWDGRDAAGHRVAPGSYTLRVTAVADGGRASSSVPVRVRR